MISGSVVEELYGAGWVRDDVQDCRVNGKVIQQELWRRGNVVEVRQIGKTVKVLSSENQCLQSLFAQFEEEESCHVVVREVSRLKIYSQRGEEHLITLPIPLKSMWRCVFGLILESDLSTRNHYLDDPAIPTPKLLALHHPLDDFTRIVAKEVKRGSLSEWHKDRCQILLVSEEPSIVVTFDSETVSFSLKIFFHGRLNDICSSF